ncbi:uncharacterized protein N7515_009899 [Penicillium bovifimosum]|uniref:Uncharacterized protein n=1 Tax=Penicillium bovifimosum TaxID=126998 RepID=A0A9W9GHT6_9EURO|nr:uncharacterized protein N7515_009899 [Penicillium bovifimosum]KAJ5120511.1 hypothetical protein N7515_009899 [Penicillium bovifimosum]
MSLAHEAGAASVAHEVLRLGLAWQFVWPFRALEWPSEGEMEPVFAARARACWGSHTCDRGSTTLSTSQPKRHGHCPGRKRRTGGRFACCRPDGKRNGICLGGVMAVMSRSPFFPKVPTPHFFISFSFSVNSLDHLASLVSGSRRGGFSRFVTDTVATLGAAWRVWEFVGTGGARRILSRKNAFQGVTYNVQCDHPGWEGELDPHTLNARSVPPLSL